MSQTKSKEHLENAKSILKVIGDEALKISALAELVDGSREISEGARCGLGIIIEQISDCVFQFQRNIEADINCALREAQHEGD